MCQDEEQIQDDEEQWFTTFEAARYLNVSEGTLARRRHNGDGPPYYKAIGISYRKSDLDAWVESHRRTSTRD